MYVFTCNFEDSEISENYLTLMLIEILSKLIKVYKIKTKFRLVTSLLITDKFFFLQHFVLSLLLAINLLN